MNNAQRPTKLRYVDKELRWGWNKSDDTNASFTRVFLERMIGAMRKNLAEFALKSGYVGSSEDPFFERIASQVHLDFHFVNPVRNSAGVYDTVIPMGGTFGPRVAKGGMSTYGLNRRGLNSGSTHTAITTWINPYVDGNHTAHAVGAFKLNNVLYAFNPWGEEYVRRNKRLTKELPDNAVWEYLRRKYNCSIVIVYTGKYLQEQDKDGVCVGLSSDFGTYMYTHLMLTERFPGLRMAIPGPETATDRIGNIVYSQAFNKFVETMVAEYRGGFKKNTGNICPMALKKMFQRLRMNTTAVHHNPVDTFNVLNKAINNNVEIRRELLAIARNGENSDRFKRVREILRNTDGRLYEVNGNSINADVRRYLTSGNINMRKLYSTNVRMSNNNRV